jgi:hypothetical protein
MKIENTLEKFEACNDEFNKSVSEWADKVILILEKLLKIEDLFPGTLPKGILELEPEDCWAPDRYYVYLNGMSINFHTHQKLKRINWNKEYSVSECIQAMNLVEKWFSQLEKTIQDIKFPKITIN